ncbi:hypothetical protein L1987_24456 [Smallanthus sonchifolius]|uniref:Uncharacterized protein n=1 Tax=Smallanthus sonchifolius TaxID=185202 RepID=A0ACB9IM86_9ASTR|nr:hypothetical protein L1987_24456 [Smallanthus sonchifolius]
MIRAYSDSPESPDPFQSISFFISWHICEDPYSPSLDMFTYPFVLKACSKLKQKRFDDGSEEFNKEDTLTLIKPSPVFAKYVSELKYEDVDLEEDKTE